MYVTGFDTQCILVSLSLFADKGMLGFDVSIFNSLIKEISRFICLDFQSFPLAPSQKTVLRTKLAINEYSEEQRSNLKVRFTYKLIIIEITNPDKQRSAVV